MNLKVLKQPYPFNNNIKRELISSLLFGTFVFLFLYLFQPFGLSQYQSEEKTLELAGYGFVTFITLFGNTLFFSYSLPKWYSEDKWTVGKNILYTLYIFFSIGLGNLWYSIHRDFIKLELDTFIIYQGLTLSVGIIPVTISTLIIHSNQLKNAVKDANVIKQKLAGTVKNSTKIIEIPSLNKSERLTINIYEICAIKAEENYVEVHYLKGEIAQKKIIRNTLKNIQEFLSPFAFIVKCHRSYLVNTQSIVNVSGNAQGLILHCGKEMKVRVSRNYVKKIKQELDKNEK